MPNKTPMRKLLRQRDYGDSHRKRRRAAEPYVGTGLVNCARCGEPIEPGEAWDLGHSDRDRRYYSGPEHQRCNRGAPHRNDVSREW